MKFCNKYNKKIDTTRNCTSSQLINKKTVIGVLFIVGFIFLIINMGNIFTLINLSPVRENLDKLYSEYNIVDTCSTSNSGGTNEITTIIKLEKENIYSLYYYDIKDDYFYDVYAGLKKGYDFNLNKYFGDKYYGLVFLDEDDKYPFRDLEIRVIIDHNSYDLESILNIIRNIADDYLTNNYNNDLEIRIYFTNEILDEKSEEYNLFLTSQLVGSSFNCDEKFFYKYNDNLVYKNYYSLYLNKNLYDDYEELERIKANLRWVFQENNID